MKERIIDFVASLALPPEAMTFVLSALPITEVRASIPFAYGVLHLPLPIVFFWAYLGSLVPAVVILLAGERLIAWADRRSRWFSKAIGRKLERTQKAFAKKYERYGELGLVLFVGVPLPLTGVWTGSLAALVFGIPFRRAFPLIAVGNAVAGIIVTLATAGIFNVAHAHP